MSQKSSAATGQDTSSVSPRSSSSRGAVPRPHSVSELYGSAPSLERNGSVWNPYADLPLAPVEEASRQTQDAGQPITEATYKADAAENRDASAVSDSGGDNSQAGDASQTVFAMDTLVSVGVETDSDSSGIVPIDDYQRAWDRAAGNGMSLPSARQDERAEAPTCDEAVHRLYGNDRKATDSKSEDEGIEAELTSTEEVSEHVNTAKLEPLQESHSVASFEEMTLGGEDHSAAPVPATSVVSEEPKSGIRKGPLATPHSKMKSHVREENEPLVAEVAEPDVAPAVNDDSLAESSGIGARQGAGVGSVAKDATLGSSASESQRSSSKSKSQVLGKNSRSARLRDLKLRLDIPSVDTPRPTVSQPRRFEEQLLANINDSAKSQQYQQLATTIQNQFPTESHATVLIVGCETDLKFSETVATLGAYLAESMGRDCLLVDAIQGPASLSSRFDQSKESGFADLIAGRHDWKELVLRTYFENLSLLPAGRCAISKNSQTTPDTARLLESMKRLHRYTLIAAGKNPLTSLLGRICDVTYLVVQLGMTESREATETVAELRASGARVLGCVVLGNDD